MILTPIFVFAIFFTSFREDCWPPLTLTRTYDILSVKTKISTLRMTFGPRHQVGLNLVGGKCLFCTDRTDRLVSISKDVYTTTGYLLKGKQGGFPETTSANSWGLTKGGIFPLIFPSLPSPFESTLQVHHLKMMVSKFGKKSSLFVLVGAYSFFNKKKNQPLKNSGPGAQGVSIFPPEFFWGAGRNCCSDYTDICELGAGSKSQTASSQPIGPGIPFLRSNKLPWVVGGVVGLCVGSGMKC